MPGHELESVFQIGVTAVFGAVASVGQLLSSAKILTPRRIAASLIAGISGGIVAGGMFGFWFPEHSQNYFLVASIGSAGGAFGVHSIIWYFMAKHAPEILARERDSTTVQSMIDSGEFSQEDIEEMIEAKHRRKGKQK